LSDYTRRDLIREFGEPGVQNPNILDLITWDEASGRVVLVMEERRAWGSLGRLRELEEKINRYLGFALDGFLAEQFPQYAGRPVTLRLDCAHSPSGDAVGFLEEARAAIEREGLAFEVRVTDPEGAAPPDAPDVS
jgi:hypothetical protein